MNVLACDSPKRVGAFTMVELMGAVTIALILIIMLYSIFDKVQKVFVKGQNRAIAMDESRFAMDAMVEDFKRLNVIGNLIGSEPNLKWMPEYAIGLNPATPVYHPPKAETPFETLISQPFMVAREIAGVRVNEPATLQVKPVDFVNYSSPGVSAIGIPEGSSLKLYHHNCRFFTFDGAWRLVHYKFGSRERYFMPISNPYGIGWVDLIDSPVGALWVYRSVPSARADLEECIEKHKRFQSMERYPIWDESKIWPKGSMVFFHEDKNYYMARKLVKPGDEDYQPWGDPRADVGNWAELNSGGIDAPMGFSRLIDGVVHFRVRAADPNDFDRGMNEYTPSRNPFEGDHLPTHVVIEIAVLDRKLLKEVESGMEQELEGISAAEKCKKRIDKINENLDRVYFFKQLIRVSQSGRY